MKRKVLSFISVVLALFLIYSSSSLASSGVQVKSVGLNANLTLNLGDKVSLGATVYPANATNKTIKWLTSNPRVATVDSNGDVTLLKTGYVTITAQSSNVEASATCKIKIVDPTLYKKNTQTTIKVNCGGPAVDGLQADQVYMPGGWGFTTGLDYPVNDKITNDYGMPKAMQSCKYVTSGSLHYKFDMPDGKYTIKMYFEEPVNHEANKRVFDVKINGKVVIQDFDPFAASGGFETGIEKVFTDVQPVNGTIDTEYVLKKDAPLVDVIIVQKQD